MVAWNRWSELRHFNTKKKKKNPKLSKKVELYLAWIRQLLNQGSTTWGMSGDDDRRIERTEIRMMRWVCGVTQEWRR